MEEGGLKKKKMFFFETRKKTIFHTHIAQHNRGLQNSSEISFEWENALQTKNFVLLRKTHA